MTPDDPFEGGTSYVDKAIEQARKTKGGAVMGRNMGETLREQYEYIAKYLRGKGAPGDLFSRLETLYSPQSELAVLRDEVARLKPFEGNYRRLKEFLSGPEDNTDQILKDAEAGRRLPLTADGVRLVPGMRVYGPDEKAYFSYYSSWVVPVVPYEPSELVKNCYSTLEALHAAENESEVKG